MEIEFKESKNNNIVVNDEEEQILIKGILYDKNLISNLENIKKLENYNDILRTCSISNYDNRINIIRNIELEENIKKYNSSELTADFLPTIEAQLKNIDKLDNELNDNKNNEIERFKREMVQRVKCLSLHKMNKSILTNTLSLTTKDRIELQNIMHTYNDIPHEIIIDNFNEIASKELFDYNLDYSNMPIYKY